MRRLLGRMDALTEADYARYTMGGDRLFTQLIQLSEQARVEQTEQALAELHQLRERMLANQGKVADWVGQYDPWAVRETLLEAGCRAATGLGRWDEALEMNSAWLASIRARGAGQIDVARACFADVRPLLELGRADEAMRLLRWCREAAEREQDFEMLGAVLSALAHIEDDQDRGRAAVQLSRDALRFAYMAGRATNISVSHGRLGYYLRCQFDQPNAAIAHHLAAALIQVVSDGAAEESSVRAVATDLRVFGYAATLPADVAELCNAAADAPGVSLEQLLSGITTNERMLQQALDELIGRARALAATPSPLSSYLAGWDPVVAGLVAAVHGDVEAAKAVDGFLAHYERSAAPPALLGVLGRCHAGERGPELAAGLEIEEAAVTYRALDALAGRVTIPTGLWRAMPLATLLSEIVAVAHGDNSEAERTRADLNRMAGEPDLAPVAHVLSRVLSGERGTGFADGLSLLSASIVATVLHHIGTGQMGEL